MTDLGHLQESAVPAGADDQVRQAIGATLAVPEDTTGGVATLTTILCSTAVFLIALEMTIISVALPQIELAFSEVGRASISWVFTAYNIGVASLLLISGWLAERFGRKRIFLVGMAIFAAASLAAAAAPSISLLIAARAVQSAGGAMLIPSSLSLMLHSVERERRDVAVGIWGAMAGLAAAVGPTLGAILVDWTGWRWVFGINVPVAVVALVLGARFLVDSRDPNISPRVDLVAVPVGAGGVGLLVFAIIAGGPRGWLDPIVAGSLLLSCGALWWFARRSVTHSAPVFDPALARRPSFVVGAAGTLFFAAGFASWLALAPTFLSEVWGYSVIESGLAIAPGPVAMAITAGPAGKLTARYGHRRVIALGALLPVLAVVTWLTLVTSTSSYVTSFLPGVVLYGVGVGIGFPMLTAAALRDVPEQQYAVGAAGNTTLRQVAMALGISLGFAIVGTSEITAVTRERFGWSWALCGLAFLATSAVVALWYPDAEKGSPPTPSGSQGTSNSTSTCASASASRHHQSTGRSMDRPQQGVTAP